jgi:AsmA protein
MLFAVSLPYLVNADAFRGRLEAKISKALGMESSIGGRVEFKFFPGFLVTIENLTIRNRGVEFASSKEVSVDVEILPLLVGDIRIKKIALIHTSVTIERDDEGQFEVEIPQATDAQATRDLPLVSLSEMTLVYRDKRSGMDFGASDCELDIRRLHFSGERRANPMGNLSLNAEINCAKVQSKAFLISNLQISIVGEDGIFDVMPVTMQVFEAHGSGNIHANFSHAVPDYHVYYSLTQFSIEEFFKAASLPVVAAGRMDFISKLTVAGNTVKEMRRSAKGPVSLRGKNLTLSGTELDKGFRRFESSQNFNLVDLVALFFSGPLGLVVTKGYNFASIYQGTGGSTRIPMLISDWTFKGGVALAQDVAMATMKNRVALHGGLDFVNDEFKDVTIALLDTKGCTKERQKILGTFQSPVVESPSPLKSFAGPALHLLSKGADLIRGKPCDVFYLGLVAQPE